MRIIVPLLLAVATRLPLGLKRIWHMATLTIIYIIYELLFR